jgi:hypothetical protein
MGGFSTGSRGHKNETPWPEQIIVARTVKAPNFVPLFQKGLLSSKRVLQKSEENKSCRKTSDPQVQLCSFLAHDLSKEATELAKKGPKFPWGPKLETFTVMFQAFFPIHVLTGFNDD